ncbi:hypothetical protein PR048_002513 [Dryococelus australis]|uniref:DDE-1 domain-containing protein n=1 Tax=Dryococelus australis TaxID=614101 RepID=A0ABQ9IKG0_9NEOP|nr:hypothetical protein PR048_002513 [Dryococelus australis]
MLLIQKKMDMLKKLDAGSSVKSMCELYGVGVSTVYDIKKQRDELCKFYVDSESKVGMESCKTLHPSKSSELDAALMKWFRLRRTAKKLSADTEAAEKFVVEFTQLVSDDKISPEQVYNRRNCIVLEMYAEKYSGTYKLKLLVIGKSMWRQKLKGVKVIPVEYTASKKAWVTTKITTEWFNSFVRQARQHCNSVGLKGDCKIILVMDNCSPHPPAETLSRDNDEVIFLSPNCTSLIQPQDQGILRSLKCRYGSEFLGSFLIAQHYTDEDILEMVSNKNNKDENYSEDSDEDEPCSYISEQQFMSLYLLKKQLEVEKAKKTKQDVLQMCSKSLSVPATVNKLCDEDTAGRSGTATPTLHNVLYFGVARVPCVACQPKRLLSGRQWYTPLLPVHHPSIIALPSPSYFPSNHRQAAVWKNCECGGEEDVK